MISEYVAWRLVRARAAEVEARAVREARREPAPRPAGPGARDAVRRFLTIRDLGRLAIVSFLVMLLGIGVVGLWTASTEPRPPRPVTDLP